MESRLPYPASLASRRRIGLPLLWAMVAIPAIAIAASWVLRPTLTSEIRPAQISLNEGQAYSSGPLFERRYFYVVRSDSMSRPERSRLELLEDNVPLGPAHSLHQRIRETGRGSYSHWSGSVLFSSSDGTDPRTNGRHYAARVRAEISSLFVLPVIVLTPILALVASGLQFRSRLGGEFAPFSGRMIRRYGLPLALIGLGGVAWLLSQASLGILSSLLLTAGLIAGPLGAFLLICEFVEGNVSSRAESGPASESRGDLSRRLGC